MTFETEAERGGILFSETASIRDFFNRVGPWFYSWFFTAVGYRSSLKYFLRVNHQRLGLREGMSVLDAGIGTGFLTINLLKEAPIPLTITGLDFSVGMLAGLKRRLARLGLLKYVQLQVGDMRQMPFPDKSFDLLISSAAIEYLPEVKDGISEFVRVLRPGGRLIIIATRDSFMGKLIAATWKNKTLKPEYIMECMARAGITNIESLRFPWYFPHVNWWGMALLGEKRFH
jgi:ubiquinone/menaquinone biosynthesis C-methylase UbiE